MERLSCFGKWFFVATVCAVSCVGRGEREKIKISFAADQKIGDEVKRFFKDWRNWKKFDWAVCDFYKKHPSVLLRDFDTLESVLTKDLLEYLAWGADGYQSFQEFQCDRFRYYPQPAHSWKLVRDFLVYAFNTPVRGESRKWRRAFYGLEIFNHALAERDRRGFEKEEWKYPLCQYFFVTSGKDKASLKEWVSAFFTEPEPQRFCKRVFEILWADVRRWFEETDPDAVRRRQEETVASLRRLGLNEERCRHIEKVFKESRKPGPQRDPIPRCAFEPEALDHDFCPFLPPEFDLWKEKELLRERIGSTFDLEADTKRKILDAIKKYLEEGYGVNLQNGIIMEPYLRVDRLFFFKADCAVLFRFFTQRVVEDFLAPERFEKLSSEEQRAFIQKRKDRDRFPQYVTAGAGKVFGFYRKQTFNTDCSKFETEKGFELKYLNLMVTDLTLFGRSKYFIKTDKGCVLDFKEAFKPSFLKTIADLLYPELEAHLDKLSAEIEKDAKK